MDQHAQAQEHDSAPGLSGAARSSRYLRSMRSQIGGQSQHSVKKSDPTIPSQGLSADSNSYRDEHASRFYGTFISTPKSYVGNKSHQRNRRSYLLKRSTPAVRPSPTVRRITHSDPQPIRGSIIWEDYKSQQQEQTELARRAVSEAVARENERLILGNQASEEEDDLLDLSSPVIQPLETPTTSVKTTTEDVFGNMILQDLRARKPFVRKKAATKPESALKKEQKLHQPEPSQTAPPSTMYRSTDDLIEL